MPRKFDNSVKSLLYLPSLQPYFCPDTGRSNFLETILKVVDASGYRKSFDAGRTSCICVKNPPYSPIFIVAEDKFVDGNAMFRLIDVRIQKRKAVITDDGFPLSIAVQGNGSESVRYGGLVLEQEYGGSYTGNVGHIDPIGLSEGIAQLELWNSAIMDAGYVESAAKSTNVTYMSNRYAFEEEIKITFPSYV